MSNSDAIARPPAPRTPPGLGDSEQYGAIGTAFVSSGKASRGDVGSAPSLLFSMRELVDFATAEWRQRPVGQY